MLSYQHIYHAGCLADLHKHAALCAIISKMTEKDKPLSYVETHAGRGLYDLNSVESKKTGEAEAGVLKLAQQKWFSSDHPYMQCLDKIKKNYGDMIYPGSAALASELLRRDDQLHLMELHPQEVQHLRQNMNAKNIHIYERDGYQGLLALSPPNPRRGLVFVDPSFEIKSEYEELPAYIEKLYKKWNVAVLCIWYPLLPAGLHNKMLQKLTALNLPKSFISEVLFTPAPDNNTKSRGMYGSGLFIANAPFGLSEELEQIVAALSMAGTNSK